MNITMRSHLIAGAAAIVGTSAIALTPIMQPALQSPALRAPSVALSALSNPISQVIETTILANDLFTWKSYDTDPGGGAYNWNYAGIGDILNQALYDEPSLGYYSYVGLVPQMLNDPLPSLRQLGLNWTDYVNTANYYAGLAGLDLSDGLWALPGEVVTAVQQAIGGDFQGAIQTLVAAVVGPVKAAVDEVRTAAQYVISNVVSHAAAVAQAIPGILQTFAKSIVGGGTLLVKQSLQIAQGVISGLVGLDFEAAWNSAVEGLLGPSGLPGTLLNLTIGAGVQTGPITDVDEIPANFVPSLRTGLQGAQWSIAKALGADVGGAAAIAPAASKAAPAASLKAAASSSPDEGTASTGGTSSDSDDSGAPAGDSSDAPAPTGTKGGGKGHSVKHGKPSSDSSSNAGGTGRSKGHGGSHSAAKARAAS